MRTKILFTTVYNFTVFLIKIQNYIKFRGHFIFSKIFGEERIFSSLRCFRGQFYEIFFLEIKKENNTI